MLSDYERIFSHSIPQDGYKYILPGAIGLLEALSRTGSLVALYTGDSPGIVKAVFKATGLGRYFRFAVYGTEVETRADMVRQAMEKAEKLTGSNFRDKDIVIIGDSVRDIDCGKQFNALTIAVATGFHSEEKLREMEPDYLFKSLEDHSRILKAIGVNRVSGKTAQ